MSDVLGHKRFSDEAEAYKWVEAQLWPHGPVCPRCGQIKDRITKLQGSPPGSASTSAGTAASPSP